MKHLVIGGCGFIGCIFAEKLLEKNQKVMVIDNLSRKGAIDNLKYFQDRFKNKIVFKKIDIRYDYKKLLSIMEQVDVVYHLAAQVAVTTSLQDPRHDFENNALGTLNVIEAIRNSARRPMLLFASTNKVYGKLNHIGVKEQKTRYVFRNLKNGVTEKERLDFHSPYGCSKGAGDQYINDYARTYGLRTVVFRQSCIYGPRQFGVEDQGWVAWLTIAAHLNKKITIYGNGKQVRDLLYIDDLFELWWLASKNIDTVTGETFNIGGGINNTFSVLEFIDFLRKHLNIKINCQFGPWRAGDQPIFISDNSKAYRLLNWKPRIGIDRGFRSMNAWIIKHIDLIEKVIEGSK